MLHNRRVRYRKGEQVAELIQLLSKAKHERKTILTSTEPNAPLPPLKGRLKNHVTYWESINAARFIIEVIKSGYRIPFINTPVSKCFSNDR